MPIKLEDRRIAMPNPFSNISFIGTTEKCPRYEEVTETVQTTVFESDFAGWRRKLRFQWLYDLLNESISDQTLRELATQWPLKQLPVGQPR